ncbi:MAG: type II toxin-antitoxin system VapC family toxin [Candidatus Eisenbacteria sp.]|nr:type II toxin-antitoxin system VapC family toxin [Candidatus Eisenbacteria bacterium]
MVLVDTSIWIDHLRRGNPRLVELLTNEQVLCHPHVVGELACGNLRKRQEILVLLRALPTAPVADDEEVLHLLESKRLHGCGLGWIDAHLLASALLSGSGFWTLDKQLERAAIRLKIPSPRF